MSSREYRALETPKHLLAYSQERRRRQIFWKKAACNQSKFFNFGKEACYGLPDKSSLCGTRFQLSSAKNVRTINSRQPRVQIPILLCYKHTAFCPGVEIFPEKMCGQRAALSCQYNQPFGDYYQPVLDYWEKWKSSVNNDLFRFLTHIQAGLLILQSDPDFKENFVWMSTKRLDPQSISLWSKWQKSHGDPALVRALLLCPQDAL